MSNRTFAELGIYEKILALLLGAYCVLGLICLLVGYRPSGAWLWVCGLMALYLGGIIWQEKIDELKRRVQKLEDRIDGLETRIPNHSRNGTRTERHDSRGPVHSP
jgi:hypothetical protein